MCHISCIIGVNTFVGREKVHANIFIPHTFVDDVESYIPSHLSIDDYLASCKKPLRTAIRVNTKKMSVDSFKQYADQNDWQITQVPWCENGFWLVRPENQQSLSLGNTDIHLSGCIYVQEASSMMPVTALLDGNDLSDCCVLDMAAAPGSKSTQIAEALSSEGVLVANEYSSSRIKSLSANMQRLGISNCALSHFDASIFGQYMEQSFDHILLDAPCSGEGTIRKDENALKNWSIESNIEIADVQKRLIESAFYALKAGGTLVYSTCTLTPLENQAVCQHLLTTFADHIEVVPLNHLFENAEASATDEGYLHIWPQIYDTEGFFVAKFVKNSHVSQPEPKIKKGAFPFTPADKKITEQFNQIIKKQFAMKPLAGELWQRDQELWLFPSKIANVIDKIKYSRIGILLGKIHKNGVRLNHEFATCFGSEALKNTHKLSLSEASDFFQGKDIKLAQVTSDKDEVLLMLNNTCVGLGKWQKNKIKNGLPRELVRDSQLITWE